MVARMQPACKQAEESEGASLSGHQVFRPIGNPAQSHVVAESTTLQFRRFCCREVPATKYPQKGLSEGFVAV